MPSDARARTTTPEAIFATACSANSRRTAASTPSTFRDITGTPFTSVLAGHDLVDLGVRRFALEIVNLVLQFALLFQNPRQGSSEFLSRRFQHLGKCTDQVLIFFQPSHRYQIP